MYVNVAMVLDCIDLGLDYIPNGYKDVRVLDMRRNNKIMSGAILCDEHMLITAHEHMLICSSCMSV
jgi:hypothetical protein